MAEDIRIWSAYKARKYAEIEAHRKADLPEPLILPHPDDVEIDEQTGVTIVGPLNREEYDAAVQTQRFIDAVLLQEALDRRKGKRTDAPSPGLGDPLTTVLIVNKSLGNWMAYSNEQLIDRRMCLAGRSIRDLERETYQAWKRAEIPSKRGSKGLDQKLIAQILKLAADASKLASDSALSKAGLDAEIESLVVKHLG